MYENHEEDTTAQDMPDAEMTKVRNKIKINVFVAQAIIGLIWGLLNGLLSDTATIQGIINIAGLLIAVWFFFTGSKLMKDVNIKYPILINTSALLLGVVVVRSAIDMFL